MKKQKGKQKTHQFKIFKSKVECLEDAVFESGMVKHATQFTMTLKDIIDYIQIKYNSNVAI